MEKVIPKSQDIEVKEEFEKRYRELLGGRYDEFIDVSLRFLRKSVRCNTLKMGIGDLKRRMQAAGWRLEQIPWCKEGFWVEHEEGRKDIGCTLEHVLGYCYVQEAASMIPPLVLAPTLREVVLDMCAAPGSKSTQIAQYMQNNGVLVCNDATAKRLAPLSINLQRCGVKNAIVTHMHGNSFKKKGIAFDKILVDAPCSGTGTIRKSLKTIRMWNPKMVKRLAATQKKLLESAFLCLKEGGTLVYSTCTLEPEEDEGVVHELLSTHEDAEIEKIKLDITRSQVVREFKGKEFDSRVRHCLRIWPQDNDTEGFFVAKLRKS